jgi:ATP synthase protein I
MTTESKQDTRPGAFVLLGAAAAALAVGLLMVLLAALVSGATAALSVAAGVGLVVCVIGFGVFTLNTVASIMPSATVLVALVTYALQLVVMAAVLLTLVRNGVLEDTLDRRWLGGGVAVAALAWMVAQIIAAMRARIPVYDLPEAGAR